MKTFIIATLSHIHVSFKKKKKSINAPFSEEGYAAQTVVVNQVIF